MPGCRKTEIRGGARWLRRLIAAALAALVLMSAAASAEGSAVEYFARGWACYTGSGAERDVARAAELLETAAGMGHAGACYALGCIYRDEAELRDPEAAARWFEEAARLGDTDAMCALGTLYYLGEGVEQDAGKTREWYEAAGDLGNPEGYYLLGERCMALDEYKFAAHWYDKAGELGHAAAMCMAAQLYWTGKGVQRDRARAGELLRLAAEAECPEAQYLLATLYLEGEISGDHETEAALYISRAARQGHAAAQYRLGKFYEDGECVARDMEKARLWYGCAAEQGYFAARQRLTEPEAESAAPVAAADAYAEACYAEGERYRNGDGVVKNDALALQWYRLAARRGHAAAQYALSQMYALGEGVPEDEERAKQWCLRAAEGGDAQAQRRYARYLASEFSLWPDLREAAAWLERAAAQGDAEAQYELGCLYATGRGREIALFGDWDWDAYIEHLPFHYYRDGVAQDLNAAAEWFARAAAQGDVRSTFLLGVLYETGRGMPRDVARAADCYRAAAQVGLAQAGERLAALTGEIVEPAA